MRYIGNKTKLLDFIDQVIKKHKIEGKIFADLFSGAGSVGDYFKDKYKIISNDFMYYSFVLNNAKTLNGEIPSFQTFETKHLKSPFDWLNEKSYTPNKHYFIYNNYTPIGGRMFFTEENGLKIDGIRISIENFYRDKVISDAEYYFLIASLIESVTKFSNTSGTYEAFFKFWDSRAKKKFTIKPLEFKHSNFNNENEIFQENTNELVRRISGDIAYIDPPYSVTQYASAYHILETIAKYDFPFIKGVGGKRDKGKSVSYYSRKKLAKDQFEDLFRQLEFKHILISYSNQSIVPLEELIELAKIFSLDGEVYVEDLYYKEYKNHRSSNKGKGKKLKEVIIYFKKDLNFNKSPLNYSGSKDRLLKQITKQLPKHIDTFVDVMGGAFNVGANITVLNRVIYNEHNPYIYNLIRWLTNKDKDKIIKDVEKIILEFNLKKSGKEEYLRLRNYYNNQEKNSVLLYVLHMYGFQNMIRFNNSQKYNTPVGVAGYSDDIKNRIANFVSNSQKYEFMNLCYTQINFETFETDTVFYFDPPYFITSAAYNDGKRGMKGWNGDSEVELLSILAKIDTLGYKFILSNVITHKAKVNHLLQEWIEEHCFKVIEVGITGWRYSKNEVLIKNF